MRSKKPYQIRYFRPCHGRALSCVENMGRTLTTCRIPDPTREPDVLLPVARRPRRTIEDQSQFPWEGTVILIPIPIPIPFDRSSGFPTDNVQRDSGRRPQRSTCSWIFRSSYAQHIGQFPGSCLGPSESSRDDNVDINYVWEGRKLYGIMPGHRPPTPGLGDEKVGCCRPAIRGPRVPARRYGRM